MEKTKIKPLSDYLLILPLESETTLPSGIVIPDSAKEKPQDGEVIAVGPGKKDETGKEISHSHPNARYTVRLENLGNCDSELQNPQGVEVKGVIYGGRDSDTWVPVFESFDYAHGVITIASSLESETTSATLGAQGVRKFNPMANMDFLSMPIGNYIKNHLNFAKDLKENRNM